MKKLFAGALCFLFLAVMLCSGANAAETIKMSTTTSTRDSGLLEYLLPIFKQDTGIEVQVIAKGTGAAIRDGVDGNVDVIFVHDTAREEKFVADGFGTKRYAVMHNDFVLLGPAKDTAKIKGEKSIGKALQSIAAQKISFISRGDDSGTHARELALWRESGLPLVKKGFTLKKQDQDVNLTFEVPDGAWYISIGQGMGKTLMMAEEKQGYTISDRGTYIQQKFGKKPPLELEILVEGDKGLLNPYGIIPVNPAKHPSAQVKAATQFAEWLVSPKGQKTIASYKLEGRQLFFPDAIPDIK